MAGSLRLDTGAAGAPHVAGGAGTEVSGILYLVGAAFMFSVMSLFVKLAGATLSTTMIVFARAVITLVLSYAWLRAIGVPAWGNDRPRLLLRGVLGTAALWCFYFAIGELPIAEVTVFHYLSPVLTALFAALFLGERVDGGLRVAIPLSLAGLVLVARPSFLFGAHAELSLRGVVAAVAGAVFAAGAYTAVRRLSRTDHALVIILYLPLVAVPVTLPFVVPAWTWPTGEEWLLLLGVGVSTQLAQVFVTYGLARVTAGRATAIGYTQILFATAYGVLFFGEVPGWTTAAGTAAIVTGTVVLAATQTWAIRAASPRQ